MAMILLLINIILLVVGTFMDMAPALLIFTPIFLPVAKSVGMDAIQFGVMMVMNLSIGTITPPVGSVLFVGSSIAKLKVEDTIKPLVPYFVAIVIALLLVTFVPAISTWLPTVDFLPSLVSRTSKRSWHLSRSRSIRPNSSITRRSSLVSLFR